MAKPKGKPVKAIVKLQIPAGKANPAPPVGSVLGPHGIQIADFCKQFNDATREKGNAIIPVELTIYEDRSFSFILKSPPASYLIKDALKLKSGSPEPHTNKVGTITRKQLEDIAEIKKDDLNAHTVDQAVRIIAGTARSMGVKVEG